MTHVRTHPEVADALRRRRAVVALETAVLTHGLPRTPLGALDAGSLPEAPVPGWDPDAPLNLEVARAVGRVVRQAGAVPATIGVMDGTLRVGLDVAEIEVLAADHTAPKAAADTLAYAIAGAGNAGTTVSATLIACGLATPAPISVLATGGIGGVHRGWTTRPDVSADLRVLGATPTCVVCAGAKSILDLDATLEVLQTIGVPVVGYGTSCFPRFLARGTDDLRLAQRVDDAMTAGRLCRVHWNDLARPTGVVLAANVPEVFALDAAELAHETDAAEAAAKRDDVSGAARTPYLLADLSRRSSGRTIVANIALLLHNARIAAAVAAELAAPADS